MEKEAYLLHCCRYIVLNPWAAGLVDHPKDWPWSSYKATVGLSKPPDFLTTNWLLEIFGSNPTKARGNYTQFVEADMVQKGSKLEYKYQSVLGSEKYAETILKKYGPFSTLRDINNTQLRLGRPPLDRILKGSAISKSARNLAIQTAYRDHKYPLKDIANHLRMNPNYLCDILKKLET